MQPIKQRCMDLLTYLFIFFLWYVRFFLFYSHQLYKLAV